MQLQDSLGGTCCYLFFILHIFYCYSKYSLSKEKTRNNDYVSFCFLSQCLHYSFTKSKHLECLSKTAPAANREAFKNKCNKTYGIFQSPISK